MANLNELDDLRFDETAIVELQSQEVDDISGAWVPIAIALFALGYTIGKDIANR